MTPNKAYDDQRRHAEFRGIEWQFSYAEWLEMWLVSNKWEDRGKMRGKFQMCRYNDIGPYSNKNCYIACVEANQEDRSPIDIATVNSIVTEYLFTNKSQYEVAETFGINQSHVSRLVNKHRRKYGQDHTTGN